MAQDPDYSKMSQNDFDACLSEVLSGYTAEQIVHMVPDIYSEVIEYFNDKILDLWASKQTDQGE